ncbi:ketosteroid isomerase family protein [Mycobacterium sp. 94-17]|uniref:ketosteroid isomerase family protein n=1 Tax=Mycobacterium sp. 94-17 TaxID=2986147 RepID=UPI002D1F6285|nr:ketosteroid isomerase family protein [Mycobacterium sp. 94-17]MEB4212208.1 nuclear transport factor 2 family protein [Mycobacterium sp. 94-17]
MVVPLDREHLLAAVERSPQAAAAHDRAGWVGLFTGDGRVEDPVGSRPHVGREQIGRFYDTFIGPRDIKFHRDLDIVIGTAVLRDLELEVAMGPAVTMYIPAFLRYDLREAHGEWKIGELQAYWELPAMILQFLRAGPGAVRPALNLSKGLLRNQGWRGAAGFMTGFRRVGARHQRLVTAFLDAVARKDESGAARLLSAGAAMTLGDRDPLDLTEFVEQLDGAAITKTIGAGPTVALSLNSGHGRAIVFAEVARRGDAITRVTYFPG